MPGAVEYSHLPRVTRTPAAAEVHTKPSSAAAQGGSKPSSATGTSSRPSGASTKLQSTSLAQQQQHVRDGSPAQGALVDVLQFGREGSLGDTSLPLSEVVICVDRISN